MFQQHIVRAIIWLFDGMFKGHMLSKNGVQDHRNASCKILLQGGFCGLFLQLESLPTALKRISSMLSAYIIIWLNSQKPVNTDVMLGKSLISKSFNSRIT